MRANLILDEREHDSVVERAFEFRSPSEVLRISNELSTFCEEPLDACPGHEVFKARDLGTHE